MATKKQAGRRASVVPTKGTKPKKAKPRTKRKDGSPRAENTYPKPPQDSGRANALTDAQVGQLSLLLVNTGRNVYEQCRQRFKLEVGEEVFERLYKVCKLCRCDLCSQWKDAGEGVAHDDPKDGVSFVCTHCSDGVGEDDLEGD